MSILFPFDEYDYEPCNPKFYNKILENNEAKIVPETLSFNNKTMYIWYLNWKKGFIDLYGGDKAKLAGLEEDSKMMAAMFIRLWHAGFGVAESRDISYHYIKSMLRKSNEDIG